METGAFIVFFPALSRSVCFLNNPVTLFGSFLCSLIAFTLSAHSKSLKTHILHVLQRIADVMEAFILFSSIILLQYQTESPCVQQKPFCRYPAFFFVVFIVADGQRKRSHHIRSLSPNLPVCVCSF